MLRTFAFLMTLAALISAFEIAARKTSGVSTQGVRRLRLAHATPTDFAYHAAAEAFARLVSERSGGALQIDIYPNGQLGSEQVCLDSLVLGTLDFSIVNQAYTSSLVSPFGFLGVAYLFTSEEHLRRTVFAPAFLKQLDRYIADRRPGFALLATLPCGARSLYTTRPVPDFASLRGRMIRIMPSAIESRVWTAFGAHGLSVPFGDVYSALQTDLAEGAENTPSAYATSRHYEVAPHFALTRHQFLTANLLVSDRAWATFSNEEKSWLREAAIEACRLGADAASASDREMLSSLQNAGKITVTDIDTAPFASAVRPLHEELASSLGAEALLNLVHASATPGEGVQQHP